MTDPTEDMLCLQEFDETVADFYRLDKPKVPWGDYGSILVHGMSSSWRNDDTAPLELQRTGPFLPPISFPLSRIIVTDAVRGELESSGLTGFSFVPAIKKTIVRLDWHEWDLFADEPAFHPEGGEPESYILGNEHSPTLAARMPELWAMVIPLGAMEVRVPEGVHYSDTKGQIFIRAGSWKGTDFFHADTTLYNYVSPLARSWLLDHYPAWLSFKPVETK